MTCRYCGKENSDNDAICKYCGNELYECDDKELDYVQPVTWIKHRGALILIAVIIVASIVLYPLSMIMRELSVKNQDQQYATNIGVIAQMEELEKYIVFDETMWVQYKSLYRNHRELVDIVDKYNKDMVDVLSFYEIIKNSEQIFADIYITLDNGDNADSIAMFALKTWSEAAQKAVISYMNYIETGEDSYFSEAEAEINTAKRMDDYVLVLLTGKLSLQGISEDEIQEFLLEVNNEIV